MIQDEYKQMVTIIAGSLLCEFGIYWCILLQKHNGCWCSHNTNSINMYIKYSLVSLLRGPVSNGRAYTTALTGTEYKSRFQFTKDTTYLALTSELLGVFYDEFSENWQRFDGTALYCIICIPHNSFSAPLFNCLSFLSPPMLWYLFSNLVGPKEQGMLLFDFSGDCGRFKWFV